MLERLTTITKFSSSEDFWVIKAELLVAENDGRRVDASNTLHITRNLCPGCKLAASGDCSGMSTSTGLALINQERSKMWISKNAACNPDLDVPDDEKERLNQADQCQTAINQMTHVLWGGLLTKDTWNFRQAAGYGMNLSGEANPDYAKQDELVRSVLKELGPRAAYIERAYHFIDNLTAYAAFMGAEGETLERFLDHTRSGIPALGEEFGRFLADGVKDSFELKLDFTTKNKPECVVKDLPVDVESLSAEWSAFTDKMNSILEPKE